MKNLKLRVEYLLTLLGGDYSDRFTVEEIPHGLTLVENSIIIARFENGKLYFHYLGFSLSREFGVNAFLHGLGLSTKLIQKFELRKCNSYYDVKTETIYSTIDNRPIEKVHYRTYGGRKI